VAKYVNFIERVSAIQNVLEKVFYRRMNVTNKEGDDIFYMARRHLGLVMVSMF